MKKKCMDSIVTPEHLYALFYGFDEFTAIKNVPFPFNRSHSLSNSHRPAVFVCVSVCLLLLPSRSQQFRLLSSSLLCVRFHSVSFIHFFSYRFSGNCCASQQQPCCHSANNNSHNSCIRFDCLYCQMQTREK